MPSNTYDPTIPQPTYQAYQPPEPAAPPPPVPQSQPFQFTGAPISKAGAAAGLLDNIFKGYMNGKAAAAQKVAGQFKAKSDNLRASYEQDAQRLDGLARSGAKPGDAEYDTAVSAVQGSWGAMKEWQDKIINGPDGNKPKKSKKSAQGQGQQQPDQPQTPQQQLQQLAQDAKSPDPKVKLAALHKIDMMKGPPVLWQIKQYQTPEYQAQRQTAQLGGQHELSTAQAQATIDELAKTPQSRWTQPQREQYNQAYAVVNPPKPAAAPKPGDAVLVAADDVIGRIHDNPGYKLTPQDHEMLKLGGFEKDTSEKQWYNQKTGAVIQVQDDGTVKVTPTKTGSGTGGAGGGSGMEKSYQKALAYYKDEYPDMPEEEREALAHRKVEGAGAQQAGAIAHDAISEPKAFDNDVISAAIDRLRALPQYKDMKTLDDALANIVGQGDNGYQYHSRGELGKPDKSGKYSGDVKEDQLKKLESDLQTQIRTVMSGSKETALSPQARRAAKSRMQPLFGPAAAPAGGGAPPGSPQAAAAPSAAPASSLAPQGGKSDEPRERKIYQHGQLHGTIKLTDAEAKQLADDADFKAQGGTIK
jgi:hypothetical protein